MSDESASPSEKIMEAIRNIPKPGERVGAILDGSTDPIKFLGFGVYVGDEIPPDLPEIGPNPKIRLDNGSVAWGYQCWWGAENKVAASLAEKNVVVVTLSGTGD